jgi:hypothetical protein
MRGPRRLTLVAAVVALCLAPATSAAALTRATVPPGFVGMNAYGQAFTAAGHADRQFREMARSGVQSVRVVFNWSSAQPYPDWNHVPIGKVGEFATDRVPTDFAATDRVVGEAAAAHLRVMPVVMYAPYWDQAPHPSDSFAVPRSAAAYGSYLSLLVRRYGSHGSFWRRHPELPKVPIRAWQVWNEENLLNFWPAPLVPNYVDLLRAAHTAIKSLDPGAEVVLGGMPNFVWTDLKILYRGGAHGLFDAVAVHPYTGSVRGVLTIVELVRQVMDRHGDRHKPILITELTWPAAAHRTPLRADFITTPAGQAHKVAAVIPLLARNRRRLGLGGFYYFDWISSEVSGADAFNFAGLEGLRHGHVVREPAFYAFRRAALAVEGVRATRSISSAATAVPGR